jgi:hypothetical protein
MYRYSPIYATVVFQRKVTDGEIAKIEKENNFSPHIPPMPPKLYSSPPLPRLLLSTSKQLALKRALLIEIGLN